jgi:hypothetical protein
MFRDGSMTVEALRVLRVGMAIAAVEGIPNA